MTRRNTPPQNFFLNERNELGPESKSGRGGVPKLKDIDWAAKGRRIARSLSDTKTALDASPDPSVKKHYFLITAPEEEVIKISEANKKVTETAVKVSLTGNYSQNLQRLGFEPIRSTKSGEVLVHIQPERLEALEERVSNLADTGVIEQAKWAPIHKFSAPTIDFRVNSDWLATVDGPTETIINFQPMIDDAEFSQILNAIERALRMQFATILNGDGKDYSGRRWIRCLLGKDAIRTVAKGFQSVQSIHAPLVSDIPAINLGRGETPRIETLAVQINNLPVVAMLDAGVPVPHALNAYTYARYSAPYSAGMTLGDHGSSVASRLIFGEISNAQKTYQQRDLCRFMDILVNSTATGISDKSILPAIQHCVANEKVVRVFNLSFGHKKPLEQLEDPERGEYLQQLQDLDNIVFNEDIVVVVCAGNSVPGDIPQTVYPGHHTERNWPLPSIARGVNSLVVGAFASRHDVNGVAKARGLPSPFTRTGPGMAGVRTPSLSEAGGDADSTYSKSFGAIVCTAAGQWVDTAGTSFAAPLLARKVAWLIRDLESYCPPGTQPFGCLIKAFLHLTASHPGSSHFLPVHKDLVAKTLGRGEANPQRFISPDPNRCIFFWQGRLPTKNDVCFVRVPIPSAWLGEAKSPKARIIWAWDSPVNATASEVWMCRKVDLTVRNVVDGKSFKGSNPRMNHDSFPLRERILDLSRQSLEDKEIEIVGDQLIFEFDYKELTGYPFSQIFTNSQRVGLVVELFDDVETPVSPQSFVVDLGVTTLNRLSVQGIPVPLRAN